MKLLFEIVESKNASVWKPPFADRSWTICLPDEEQWKVINFNDPARDLTVGMLKGLPEWGNQFDQVWVQGTGEVGSGKCPNKTKGQKWEKVGIEKGFTGRKQG